MVKLPTDAELEILRPLWEHGPSTVRQVLAAVRAKRDVSYNHVLKLMQIMHDKGLLECDKSVRPQVYRATKPRSSTQKRMVVDLVNRAFGGSPGNLILQALASKKSTPEERQRIRDYLEKLEGDDT